eukprot:8609465-Karenia_brevis.AAC.1
MVNCHFRIHARTASVNSDVETHRARMAEQFNKKGLEGTDKQIQRILDLRVEVVAVLAPGPNWKNRPQEEALLSSTTSKDIYTVTQCLQLHGLVPELQGIFAKYTAYTVFPA